MNQTAKAPLTLSRPFGRTLFSWSLTEDELARVKAGEKVRRKRKAPPGYGFNGRGDLINLRREALRRGVAP